MVREAIYKRDDFDFGADVTSSFDGLFQLQSWQATIQQWRLTGKKTPSKLLDRYRYRLNEEGGLMTPVPWS